MNINLIFILLVFLFSQTIINAQFTERQIDSLINEHDRQYRVVLNTSDSILIDKQIEEIGSNCKELEKILATSNQYSNNYKIHLLKKFTHWNSCPDVVLNYADMQQIITDDGGGSIVQSILDEKNYPIYQSILNEELYYRFFIEYLKDSEYLNDCYFLLNNKSIMKLKLLSNLIRIGGEEFQTKQHCKKANIMILKELYPMN